MRNVYAYARRLYVCARTFINFLVSSYNTTRKVPRILFGVRRDELQNGQSGRLGIEYKRHNRNCIDLTLDQRYDIQKRPISS